MADDVDLEEFIQELEGYRGRHTELITVYVPQGYSLLNIAKQLEQEKSTAVNIKSKSTRKNVLDALERMTRHLKLITKTPENGLALFAGNISDNEGQVQIEVWSIEPPKPLKARLYRCDQEFVLDPLKEMLEVEEVYGLVVIEINEATIGLLEGKRIEVLQKMTSGVPGKTEKGGQCLSPDTLIMRDNGEIIEIKDSHNPLFVVSENFNTEKSEKTPLIYKWKNNKQLFKIITKYPRLEIKSSADHIFFVRTENGIEEKSLSDIREGDFLLMPGKIDIRGELQKINFEPTFVKGVRKIKIPGILDENLALIFGYYLGDGSYEKHRINFFEQREDVAKFYSKLLEDTFGISCKMKFREDKNYYRLRLHNHYLAEFFGSYFSVKNKTLNEEIPLIVLRSPDNVLVSFIKGFFDAEGYVSPSRVGLGINNEKIIKQLQLSLLRLGIISSFMEYDNFRNPYSKNTRYTLEISCLDSLKKFKELIGFTSSEKRNKLDKIINNRGNQNNINQIVVNGRDIARIIKNSGESLEKFGRSMFFNNKRQMSREVFKRIIIDKVDSEDLRKRLLFIYDSNLVLAKINKIVPLDTTKTFDIETKNHNFIANGLIVHNSAARYGRIREGMKKEFYRRIAEAVKSNFWDMKKLKGILVGGPGPTKEDFLKEGQLVTALKEKIIAVKDIGYADEHGLELLVEVSQDVLSEQEIIKEKKILEDFLTKLAKTPNKIVYGLEDVKKALGAGAVDTLIMSKKLDKKYKKEYREAAENISAKIEIVSEETEEGQQFASLGGIAAILRFEIHLK